MPEVVGKIEGISRYSVKSLAGEDLTRADVTWQGLVGDRSWYVLKSDDTVLTAKQTEGEALLQVVAHVHGGKARVYIDGRWLDCGSPEAEKALSKRIGQPVRLRQVDDQIRLTNAMFSLRAGVGYDSSPLHLLTTASLASIDSDDRRFRPNIMVSVPRDMMGFPENSWVGHDLLIGNQVQLRVRKRTERCALPARRQLSLSADPEILRTIKRANDNQLGVYASVVEPGKIKRGDTVTLL